MMNRQRSDEGSINVFLATAAFALIIVVGIAVDLGGKVHAQQQARAIAAQAARAGAQQMRPSSVTDGSAPSLDPAAAVAAAQQYLATAGVTGTATVVGGDTLRVTTKDTYDSKVLGIIGIDSATVTGEASARLIRTQGGNER